MPHKAWSQGGGVCRGAQEVLNDRKECMDPSGKLESVFCEFSDAGRLTVKSTYDNS